MDKWTLTVLGGAVGKTALVSSGCWPSRLAIPFLLIIPYTIVYFKIFLW